MIKIVAALALAGSFALVGAAGAQANHDPAYPSSTTDGTVNDGTVEPGETVIFSGEGFFPGEEISITADSEPTGPSAAVFTGGGRLGASISGKIPVAERILSATTAADAEGKFSYPIMFTEEGVYTLTATGLESGHVVTAQVVVDGAVVDNGTVAEGPESEGGLAYTGLDSGTFLWGAAGLGALGLGAATVMVARRRAESDSESLLERALV